MHVVPNVSHLDSKIAVLENMLKGFISSRTPISQSYFGVLFSLSDLRPHIEFLSLLCLPTLYLSGTCKYGLKDLKITFLPFNTGWRNHPSFFQSSGRNAMVRSSQPSMFSLNNFSPSLILLILIEDQLFRVYLMNLDHNLLLLRFNLLLVTQTLKKFRVDLIVIWREQRMLV